MLRLFLILFLCAVFWACSSDDDSVALNEWFGDRGIANSYGLDSLDIYLSVKNSSTDIDTSAFLVSSVAVLGNANGIEQSLYFGLVATGSLSSVWKLRTDTIFYRDFYRDGFPNINAEFCWLVEDKPELDTTWLKFSEPFKPENCKPVKSFVWKADTLKKTDTLGTPQDTFLVSLPDEFLDLRRRNSSDTLRLLTMIRLLTNDAVLRIAPPSIADIRDLLRVGQKTRISDECELCLHAGVGESFSLAFDVSEEDKIKIAGKPMVFAELILPKSNDATSELEFPVPVFVSSNGSSEGYRVDTAYVNRYNNHPNLVFWEGDSLRLQVTQSLRNYVNATNSRDTLGFTLRLGPPMLNPSSHSFANSRTSRVFSDRSAFALYDFSSALAEPVKLRLWFADFGDKK
ncbi:MAG: hypothetical protein LBC64_00925 [Fibromonadaceae bacterium]|jgi:hypothetical protein|nr:hypothetical protein [Fibromonadaceae bacterium]